MIQRIAVLVFDGIGSFHLSIPAMVFGEDRTSLGLPRIEVVPCALTPGRICSSLGLEMTVRHGPEAMSEADLLIVPSWKDMNKPAPPALLEGLRQAHRAGKPVVGLCLGAFLVAEAGLLDGRTATTHWAWADEFQRRFPRVELDPHVLYIDHGDVVTSAGTAAGLDCCLHLIRKEYGAELANRLARRLVIPPHRQGGQAQYVEHPVRVNGRTDRIGQTLEWAQAHLGEALDIDRLANHAAMSRRTFTRHFQKSTGMSVVPWLTQQRIRLAQRLLETSDSPVERIAEMAGFGNPLSLRIAFMKELNTTPSHYRREFAASVTTRPSVSSC